MRHLGPIILPFVLAIVACSSAKLVPYQAAPGAVSDPYKELHTLLKLRTPAPLTVEVSEQYFQALHMGSWGPTTVAYGDVGAMELYDKGDELLVIVRSKGGKEIYTYTTADLARAQRFIDTLAALSGGEPKPTAEDSSI